MTRRSLAFTPASRMAVSCAEPGHPLASHDLPHARKDQDGQDVAAGELPTLNEYRNASVQPEQRH